MRARDESKHFGGTLVTSSPHWADHCLKSRHLWTVLARLHVTRASSPKPVRARCSAAHIEGGPAGLLTCRSVAAGRGGHRLWGLGGPVGTLPAGARVSTHYWARVLGALHFVGHFTLKKENGEHHYTPV